MIVCDNKKEWRLNLDKWKNHHDIYCIHRKIDLARKISSENKFNYDWIQTNYKYTGEI